ncbi:MAG: MarR family transcriptional regulator [Firmicutes bacterium GWF2_51_9]|nr:MAG: MarR family transcriptional regulator [Firmicutes bacterium GWF2_51_9]OGS57753.1 MAG: MarR family transcriptional regulator [Firmicutes bacterium GWE2_51_13]HAM62998.1 MarR family transcriptional regulator [Erysipelotrichaceae bacterium]HBZ40599.1 MarR family transcriptional regulator [Erysipelotrichaceae bacterium]
MEPYDPLKLENQICFPLYALSREVIKLYTPILDKIGLTYTQYIVMLVMWENETILFKDLATTLHLDSGTLTAVVKKLERSGWVTKNRTLQDDRSVEVKLTQQGVEAKKDAVEIPQRLFANFEGDLDELMQLKLLLDKTLEKLNQTKRVADRKEERNGFL